MEHFKKILNLSAAGITDKLYCKSKGHNLCLKRAFKLIKILLIILSPHLVSKKKYIITNR